MAGSICSILAGSIPDNYRPWRYPARAAGPTILNLKLRHFCLALGQAGSGAWRYIRKWREMGTPVEREPAILLGSKPDEIATGPGSQVPTGTEIS